MTSKITLSNRKYSQNVLMSKSTNKSRICTVNMDLYLVNESFMFDFQTLGIRKARLSLHTEYYTKVESRYYKVN